MSRGSQRARAKLASKRRSPKVPRSGAAALALSSDDLRDLQAAIPVLGKPIEVKPSELGKIRADLQRILANVGKGATLWFQ